MEETKPELAAEEAASILLGDDPTKDWTPEQRKEVEELFATLDRPPEPPKMDLREHFSKGETIQDPNGLRIVIRSVGQEAMCVQVLGKKGRFTDGHFMNIGDSAFMTTRSRKNECVFEYLGPAMPATAPVQVPEIKKEATTTPADGNVEDAEPTGAVEGMLF